MVSTIEDTLRHAVFFANHIDGCNVECAITAVLLELGIPVKGLGFDYLVKAISLFIENPGQSYTKEIYPTIGKLYIPPTGRFQVERQIRVAIDSAWRNRDDGMWEIYFPANGVGNVNKPTNGEFISRIARFIQLWQGCCVGGK